MRGGSLILLVLPLALGAGAQAQSAAPTCAPQPDADRLQLLIEELDATVSSPQYYVQPEVMLLPQTGFSSSLWFRPPPAV